MADSKREVLLKAIASALGVASVTMNSEATTKPSSLDVHRHLTRSVDGGAHLPDVTVYYLGETPAPVESGASGESLRSVRVGVRCRAKAGAGVTGDEALDPILTWVEIAIQSDATLGGAAAHSELAGIDAISAREYADTWAEATLQFDITLLTKWGDPRQYP